jgi:alpha-mannosidase
VRGKGNFTALELDRLSEEMQTPAEYVIDSAHEGTESWSRSFFRLAPGNVTIMAMKRAEQGDAIIVRMQERAGRATEFTLESSMLGLNYKAQIKPWEIKTVLLEGARQKRVVVKEVNLLER